MNEAIRAALETALGESVTDIYTLVADKRKPPCASYSLALVRGNVVEQWRLSVVLSAATLSACEFLADQTRTALDTGQAREYAGWALLTSLSGGETTYNSDLGLYEHEAVYTVLGYQK